MNALKLFVRADDKLILFNSFVGRKYNDSPRVIFETVKADPRLKENKLVWAFHGPSKYIVDSV